MSTKTKPGSPQDFGVLLNLAFGAFKTELHEELAQAGFDDIGASFGYVFRLLDAGPLNLREVAHALGMTAPGALKIVNDMAAKGYLERREHAGDARQKPLALTPHARQAMAVAHAFHLAFEARLERGIGVQQAKAARTVLEAIVEASDARMAGERPRLRPL